MTSPSLPDLGPASYGRVLSLLTEQHASTTAFVQHLHYLLLCHFRTHPLSFLVPLEYSVPDNKAAISDLCAKLDTFQLEAVQRLPSVLAYFKREEQAGGAHPRPAARGAATSQPSRPAGREKQLRDELVPLWLRALGRARCRRAAALGCVEGLIALAFPGTNKVKTASRQLYADLLAKSASRAEAVKLVLKSMREVGGLDSGIAPAKMRALLERCLELIRRAAPYCGVPDVEATADALAELIAAYDAAEAGGGGGGGPSSAGADPASDVAPAAGRKRGPPPAAEDERRASNQGAGKRRREALADAATQRGAYRELAGRVADWFEKLVAQHADAPVGLPLSEAWACDDAHAAGLLPTFDCVPMRALKAHIKAAYEAAKRSGGAADSSSAAGPSQPGLPEGWAMAVSFVSLLEQDVLQVSVVDWFNCFSKDPIAKKAAQTAEALLATFIASVKHLQQLGLVVPSKRTRGTVDKRVYGKPGSI